MNTMEYKLRRACIALDCSSNDYELGRAFGDLKVILQVVKVDAPADIRKQFDEYLGQSNGNIEHAKMMGLLALDVLEKHKEVKDDDIVFDI